MKVLRFVFETKGALYFPAGKASNTIRGALGNALRDPETSHIFSPKAVSGPSGLRDSPRPFVLRASHLDGCSFEPGAVFQFELNLFDFAAEGAIQSAFQSLTKTGLGPARSGVELVEVADSTVTLDLSTKRTGVSSMIVRFLTPTELKGAREPVFGSLAARIRDRVSTLSELYGEGPLAIDFKGFGARASQIATRSYKTNYLEVQRRSSRTGQTHSIGGFVGEAEYAGNLGEFVLYFEAATYTGVGRQTTWGKGQIAISCSGENS